MTTLMQLRRQVRTRLGIPISDNFQTDDVIDDAINIAINTFESESRWPWQETTTTSSVTASVTTFTAPADWMATRAIFQGDDEIHPMAMADILAWPLTDAGRPQVYGLSDQTFHVRPVPDGDYTFTHVYYRTAGNLINDADTVRMPDQFTPAIISKAAEILAIRSDDRTLAASHLADYLQGVGRARREARRIVGPLRVRVREGSWI